MRILRISYRLPPLPGGKERHVESLTREQIALGHEVTVVHALGEHVPPGAAVRRVRVPRRWSRAARLWFALSAAAQVSLSRDVDVIHLHGDHVEAGLVGLAARVRGVPLVLTVHGTLSTRHGWLARLSFVGVARFMALGERAGGQLLELGISADRLLVTHSGLDTGSLRDARARRRPVSGRVVTVGTLDPVKGHDLLVKAVRTLSKRLRAVELHVVGDGPERERLSALATGLPNVTFHGSLRRPEVYALLATADLFVLASRTLEGKGEGVPTAALEAMAVGVPTLVSTDALLAPAVNEDGAYLRFRSCDVADLEARMETALTDRDGLAALSDAGVRAVEGLGWERIAAAMTDAYPVMADPARTARRPDGRMRVLEVTRTLDVGGVETLLASRLAHADHARFDYEVLAMAATDPTIADRLRAHGVRTDVMGEHLDLGTVWRTVRRVRKSDVEVISVHSPVPAVLVRLSALFRRARRPALVTTLHSTRFQPLVGRLDRITTRADETLVAVSDAVHASSVIRYKCRTIVRRAGVDTAALQDFRRARLVTRRLLGLLPGGKVVSMVAGLRAAKNHELALNAFARVSVSRPGTVLLLIGDGPRRDEIARLVSRLSADHDVRLLGRRDDAQAILAASDVLLLSSHHEGLPVVVMEALAAGVPVVATDVGGIREVVEPGRTGFLVPSSDEAALAAALVTALDGGLDGHGGDFDRARASLDVRSTARWYEGIYARVADRTR